MSDPISPLIEPIKVIGAVIKSEMDLQDGHIMLGLENWKIPNDTGIYIALFYGPETVIANSNTSSLNEAGAFVEVQDAVMLHEIVVDLMSFDSSARLRKEEVVQAINSVAAQNAMETYNMRFATTPSSFVPIPSLENTKYMNRFQSTFAVNALHRKMKTVDYYDTLQTPVVIPNP